MSDIESTLKLNRETSCLNDTVLNCLKMRETVNKVTVLFSNYVSETTTLGFPFVSLFICHIFGIPILITCCDLMTMSESIYIWRLWESPWISQWVFSGDFT